MCEQAQELRKEIEAFKAALREAMQQTDEPSKLYTACEKLLEG